MATEKEIASQMIEAVIGRELRRLREENDMTVREVAEETGIGSSSVSNYENGLVTMDWLRLETLLSTYGVTLGEFKKRLRGEVDSVNVTTEMTNLRDQLSEVAG